MGARKHLPVRIEIDGRYLGERTDRKNFSPIVSIDFGQDDALVQRLKRALTDLLSGKR